MTGSRILRWVILAAMLPLAGTVAWQLSSRLSAPQEPTTEPDIRPGDAAGFEGFRIVGTTEGRRDFLLQADAARGAAAGTQTFEGLDVFEIFRRDGRVIRVTGREPGSPPRGRLMPDGSGGGSVIRLEGGVRLEEPGGPVVETDWLEYDQAEGVVWTDARVDLALDPYVAVAHELRYSTARRELRLEGGVRAWGPGPAAERLELRAPLAVYDLASRRVRIPRSEAGGLVIRRGLERVSGDEAIFDLARDDEPDDEARLIGHVQGTLLPPDGEGGPVLFAAGAMEARRRTGGGPLRAMVLRGGARVWWRDEAETAQTLLAEEMDAEFDVTGAVRSVRARGDAELIRQGAGEMPQRLTAPVLSARLAPGPVLDEAEAFGGVRYESRGLTVRADRAKRDALGRVALRGEDAGIPTVLDANRNVVAPEIDILPGGHVVEARGGVEASLVGAPARSPRPASGLFDSERPVRVHAREMTMDTQSDDAVFRGAVRALQDDRMLRGEVVEVHDRGETVLADEAVSVRMFREREPEGRIPVLVDADRLEYREADGLLRLEGGVRYQEEGLTLDAARLVGQVSEEGGFGWAEASEGVRLLARGRDEAGKPVEYAGSGETLRMEQEGGEVLLRGGESPARLVNRATDEELAGPEVRFFLNEDRIIAGTAEGDGRTTIRKVLGEEKEP